MRRWQILLALFFCCGHAVTQTLCQYLIGRVDAQSIPLARFVPAPLHSDILSAEETTAIDSVVEELRAHCELSACALSLSRRPTDSPEEYYAIFHRKRRPTETLHQTTDYADTRVVTEIPGPDQPTLWTLLSEPGKRYLVTKLAEVYRRGTYEIRKTGDTAPKDPEAGFVPTLLLGAAATGKECGECRLAASAFGSLLVELGIAPGDIRIEEGWSGETRHAWLGVRFSPLAPWWVMDPTPGATPLLLVEAFRSPYSRAKTHYAWLPPGEKPKELEVTETRDARELTLSPDSPPFESRDLLSHPVSKLKVAFSGEVPTDFFSDPRRGKLGDTPLRSLAFTQGGSVVAAVHALKGTAAAKSLEHLEWSSGEFIPGVGEVFPHLKSLRMGYAKVTGPDLIALVKSFEKRPLTRLDFSGANGKPVALSYDEVVSLRQALSRWEPAPEGISLPPVIVDSQTKSLLESPLGNGFIHVPTFFRPGNPPRIYAKPDWK